jgi:GAF domain-containing protein
MLPDFRVRQRDYLLEIARLLTQELDLEKLLARILRVSIEMLAGQAGLIALKQPEGWRVATVHGIAPAFLSYLTPLLAEEKVSELDVTELNRMLKELTYTASMGLLNGTGLPLAAHGQVIGVIFPISSRPMTACCYSRLQTRPRWRSSTHSFMDRSVMKRKGQMRYSILPQMAFLS